ncbi:hypothetical protein [Nocardiopsis sp. LOL_012]|uniref:hypothetical protein n=1 Tax=Nocardiopsis sp. LOL_012 TaxID=3345409 RepID=UPI003A865C04
MCFTARYPITRLEADGFGPLDKVDIRLSRTLNVVTGENATGKSQLLKLLYASTRSLSDRPTLTKEALSSVIASALTGVLRPDQLGRLVRRVQGRGRASIRMKYQGISESLAFGFASNARSSVQIEHFP